MSLPPQKKPLTIVESSPRGGRKEQTQTHGVTSPRQARETLCRSLLESTPLQRLLASRTQDPRRACVIWDPGELVPRMKKKMCSQVEPQAEGIGWVLWTVSMDLHHTASQ